MSLTLESLQNKSVYEFELRDEENLILQYFLEGVGTKRGEWWERVGMVRRKLSSQIWSPEKGSRFSSCSKT